MDCICTAIGCGSLPPDIKILANVKNAAEGVFTDYEINAFYLIRTTDKFEIIDSIEMDFQSIQGILDYNRYFTVSQNLFDTFEDMRLCKFFKVSGWLMRLLRVQTFSKAWISGSENSSPTQPSLKRMSD